MKKTMNKQEITEWYLSRMGFDEAPHKVREAAATLDVTEKAVAMLSDFAAAMLKPAIMAEEEMKKLEAREKLLHKRILGIETSKLRYRKGFAAAELAGWRGELHGIEQGIEALRAALRAYNTNRS